MCSRRSSSRVRSRRRRGGSWPSRPRRHPSAAPIWSWLRRRSEIEARTCASPARRSSRLGVQFVMCSGSCLHSSETIPGRASGDSMHLSPREVDKLVLHQAGVLAQKRLARGLRLNYPEAVALISTQLLEFIRDGRSVAQLMDLGRQLLGREDVADGIPEMIDEVQVEGTFP